MNEQELIRRYASLENALSPENLHCDGERSAAQAARIRKQFLRQQESIVKQLGRVPTVREIYHQFD